MAEVIVTGGRGFLGSHLVDTLVRHGREVCATYNFDPPAQPARTPNLNYFHVDLTDFNQCLKFINRETPKVIYHLAAQPIITSAIQHPFPTMELTLRAGYNLLEAIRQADTQVEAVVFFTTDKVYGSNTHAVEDSPLAGVDHPYSASKIAIDILSRMYAAAYDLPIVVCRSGNVYGGRDFHWDRLIPGTCRDIWNEKTPVLRSNGEQMRDYIYVQDVVDAMEKMATAMQECGIRPGAVFNLGAAQSYKAVEIVRMLEQIAGREYLGMNILDRAKKEIDAQHMDYSLARLVLGWEPLTGIEQGLEQTYRWYQEWLSGHPQMD